jgi:hypothetical protein
MRPNPYVTKLNCGVRQAETPCLIVVVRAQGLAVPWRIVELIFPFIDLDSVSLSNLTILKLSRPLWGIHRATFWAGARIFVSCRWRFSGSEKFPHVLWWSRPCWIGSKIHRDQRTDINWARLISALFCSLYPNNVSAFRIWQFAII